MQMVVMIPQSTTFLIPLNSTVAHIWEPTPPPLSFQTQDHIAALEPFQGKQSSLLLQAQLKPLEMVMLSLVNTSLHA